MTERSNAEVPEGDWPGKNIEWDSEIVDGNLHVELPFWIAAPDGSVRVRIDDCSLNIGFRNDIVGIYRNGLFYRDHRQLMQITAEGYPFAEEQQIDLKKTQYGEKHFRTWLTIPVRCHRCIFELLQSSNAGALRDSRFYLQSLAHASIRFINEFIGAYRRAAFDPFVSHVSHWDLPVWSVSDFQKRLWHFSMARYPVADEIPRSGPNEQYIFRTTLGRIREALLVSDHTSLEELLDAWTCFYRGQFAEAIRKVVTSIEVAVSGLLAALPTFQNGRSVSEVKAHLARLKFNEQMAIYLRETKRELPGPLTHTAPEVNRLYLEKELDAARARRHRIVHESEKIDYEHSGPILRIMETMSWLHGWLRESNTFDPTSSPWHSANTALRDIFLFEPIADKNGLGIAKYDFTPKTEKVVLLQDVHKEQLLQASSRDSLDMAYCVAWTFQVLREPIKGSRLAKNHGIFERFWIKDGKLRRPVFLIDLTSVLCEQTINAIACRVLFQRNNVANCGSPVIVVNHLSKQTDKERTVINCIAPNLNELIQDLKFTVISLLDWVSYGCLLTLHTGRDFGFCRAIKEHGVIRFPSPCFERIGYVRRIFARSAAVSVVLDGEWLSVGDEICFQNGCETKTASVTSLEVQRQQVTSAFSMTVGIQIDIEVDSIVSESIVYRVRRPRLPHLVGIEKTIELMPPSGSKWFDRLGQFPIKFTSYGVYSVDKPLT